MSNYLSIATITATLQRVIQQAIQTDVEGATVTTSRPDNSGGLPETAVNVYLYHIKRNSALGNSDTPGRQRKGLTLKRNQIGIDLFYVITFYGEESDLEAQRLMGATIRTLEDNSVLSPDIIRATINDPAYEYISNSNLADQTEMIRTEFLSISTDELSKIWSVFFQTPYALSVVYKVTVILLEGDESAQVALPVRNRNLSTISLQITGKPVIQQVTAARGTYKPIFQDTTIAIKGQKLAHPNTQVRVFDRLITPTSIKDHEIRFNLTSLPRRVLRAGLHSVQVVYNENDSNNNNLAIESNAVAFMLRPTIVAVQIQEIDTFDDEPRNGTLRVTLSFDVAVNQRVILLLNRYDETKNDGYIFASNSREENTNTVDFRFQRVEAGQYLVRVQVEGAESIIDYQGTPATISPLLIIS